MSSQRKTHLLKGLPHSFKGVHVTLQLLFRQYKKFLLYFSNFIYYNLRKL
jgi:hypothetical protein